MQETKREFLDFGRLQSASVVAEPFPHLLVSDAIRSEGAADISADFPPMSMRGSFVVPDLKCGPAFLALIDELEGPRFRSLVCQKFGIELEPYRTLLTVRGICTAKDDGKIHTDLPDKVITVLLYLNESWEDRRGRLRLLKSDNLNDFFAEIPPVMGNMLIFKRCDWSWHGFEALDAPRRALQLNWVTSEYHDARARMQEKFSWLLRQSGRY